MLCQIKEILNESFVQRYQWQRMFIKFTSFWVIFSVFKVIEKTWKDVVCACKQISLAAALVCLIVAVTFCRKKCFIFKEVTGNECLSSFSSFWVVLSVFKVIEKTWKNVVFCACKQISLGAAFVYLRVVATFCRKKCHNLAPNCRVMSDKT